jgi:hypothetical protein
MLDLSTFIPGFSHHVHMLFDLTMKYSLSQEDSFMKLKKLLTSVPVLVLPDNNLPPLFYILVLKKRNIVTRSLKIK